MLYNEFVENTGCKENDHNYKLYKRLEIIYMNDDSITKAEIYEMGKKLMDNSKSEEQIRREAEIKADIESHKETIKTYRKEIKYYQSLIPSETDYQFLRHYKSSIKWRREDIKRLNSEIKGLRFILGGTK